ncbi:uncharacterized protein LOC124159303 isoform X2 [Ischnura elegans]|nr:uncharacterized protein LOC124159303 isoform X2 [Ischnura elegans]
MLYSACYFTLSAVYRFVLNESQRSLFEHVALYCNAHSDLIPVSFVLGFYVSIVIKRWWDQYMGIPWPDSLAMFVSTLIVGNDERGRLMRRTILRYVNLSFVVTLSMMCPRVKKRFPTLDHLVEAGFMQPTEKKIFEDLDSKTPHPKYWMPLVWAGSIVTRARKEGRIRDDFSMKTLIDGLCTFRGQCGGMLNYDWISIPLVYTQVVTLAVYIFFLATLMGHQFLDGSRITKDMQVDLVVPIFTFLQFFFYMGWLKVAESLVNPFGEDDDDFEVNWLVDRNLQVSYLIVDEMHQEHPELVKDQYWDEVFPAELPYTAAAKQYQTGPPLGSTKSLDIPSDQVEFMPMETVLEESSIKLLDDDDDDVIVDLDDIQLDLESGSQKRRETHPMRILMGRKASVSSKISGSSVAGGAGHLHGVRSRAGEIIEGMGRSLLGLSYSSSTAKGMSSSYQPKNQTNAQQPNTSFRPGGRKHSMLSMFTRMFSREDHNHAELRSHLGSNASLRSHRRGPFGRSISRVSCSQANSQANSRTSINRENTADFQDEIFKMSDLSISCSTENDIHSVHKRQRKRSHQHQRQGRRKLSVRLSGAEHLPGDHVTKEENHLQEAGEETPSTVASSPGDGERIVGKRIWVLKDKRRSRGDAKELRSDEIDNDDDFEDDDRGEEDDNGIWFAKKKLLLMKKKAALSKEVMDRSLQADGRRSPESLKKGEGAVDDLSMISDSSVKTSFYHGSWDTLAESKGPGSITTVASSPAATPVTSNISSEQGMKKEGTRINLVPSSQEKEFLQPAESWTGTGHDPTNAETMLVAAIGGTTSANSQPTSARIIVPKRNETPMKYVFDPQVSSFPTLQSSPITMPRGRVTSQLAKGIKESKMASVKEVSNVLPVQTKQAQDSECSDPKISLMNDNNLNTKVEVNEKVGKFLDCSPPKIQYRHTVQTILPPPSSPGRWNMNGSFTNDSPIAVPMSLREGSPKSVELLVNSEFKDTLGLKPPEKQPSSYHETPSKPVIIDERDSKASHRDFPMIGDNVTETVHEKAKVEVNELGLTDKRREFHGNSGDLEPDSGRTKEEPLQHIPLAPLPLKESDSLHPHVFLPHIPSSAIPVPSMSPAHNSGGDMPLLCDDDISTAQERETNIGGGFGGESVSEAAGRNSEEVEPVGGRRRLGGLRDFVELEPIEENVELVGTVCGRTEAEKEVSLEETSSMKAEEIAPETSV